MSDESIFAAALAILSPTQRAAYLDRVCTGQPDLRHQVEELLAAHAADNLLDRPPADLGRTSAYEPPAERPGVSVGPYKLLQEIGEGGMGTVFMAEQTQPVRRKVALKIIKPGMDSKQVVARFEAERQALSMMDHPNIAKVLDAGTTVSGRPYFVMELVHGVPFTDYCDANKLTPRQRLELFVPVCLAIQHAHQKGIIHRDIKPGNILVTMYDDKPVPKVIDFGVAKAVEQRLTERTLFTQFGTLVGTFEYMSPEQAEMNALGVDTRSDVYALGVLLYELLTGTTPLERQRLRAAALGEVVRLIKEEEPPRPSVRLSTSGTLAKVAASRQMEPGKLSALVRGELDWIVMRCLEKDRTRRYDTASSLARDVERYLHDESVEACPPTVGYRLRKAFRKHKAAVAVASGFVAVLFLGIVMTAWQAIRATGAEELAAGERDLAIVAHREAEQQRDQAKRANESLRRLAVEQQRTLYATSMNLAQAAWETGDPARTFELLRQQIPQPGEDDLRGFEWHYWNRLAHQDLQTVQIPALHAIHAITAARHGARLSPDGTRVAGFLTDPAALKLWDAKSGQEVWSVPVSADKEAYAQINFSQDGNRLVTVRNLQTPGKDLRTRAEELRVWDVGTGKLLYADDRPDAAGGGPSLASDGSRLAFILYGRNSKIRHVIVRQLPDGREVFRYPPDDSPRVLYHTLFSPNGKRLAVVVGEDSSGLSIVTWSVKLWDLETGREIRTFSIPGERLMHPTFSPDGWRIATSVLRGSQETVILWDCDTGKQLQTLNVPGGLDTPYAMDPYSFDMAGNRLLVWAAEQVHVFDVCPTRAAATAPLLLTFPGHAGLVVNAAFAVGGSRLMSLDQQGTVKQWNLADVAPTLRTPFGSQYFGSQSNDATVLPSPDGSRIAFVPRPGEANPRFRITDSFGRLLCETGAPRGRARGSKFSRDGRTFAALWQEDPEYLRMKILLWDAVTGKELPHLPQATGTVFGSWEISPDGARVAIVVVPRGSIGTPHGMKLSVWETATGRVVSSRPQYRLVQPSWSPDGRWIVYALVDTAAEDLVVWCDAATGDEGKVAKVRKGLLSSSDEIVFRRDGRFFATRPSSPMSPVYVWETGPLLQGESHDPVLTIAAQAGRIGRIEFSPDGRRLLTSGSGLVKLWDAVSGRELVTLQAKGVTLGNALFSPDGHTIWGGLDEAGRLWGWDGATLLERKLP